MRDSVDFNTILSALPNLNEWQASYSKPKSKSYITMAEFVPSLPVRITNLSICLENDYRREGLMPIFFAKVAMKTHICSRMAEVTSRLEHFSYTGRICHRFFDIGSRLVNPMTTRLRSIDLTVKNCCRHPSSTYHDFGSGIQELGFIEAFEKLVISAVRSLDKFKEVQYLRIRFVDLGKSGDYFVWHCFFCLVFSFFFFFLKKRKSFPLHHGHVIFVHDASGGRFNLLTIFISSFFFLFATVVRIDSPSPESLFSHSQWAVLRGVERHNPSRNGESPSASVLCGAQRQLWQHFIQ